MMVLIMDCEPWQQDGVVGPSEKRAVRLPSGWVSVMRARRSTAYLFSHFLRKLGPYVLSVDAGAWSWMSSVQDIICVS